MNFTMGIHPKLRRFFKQQQPPTRPKFKPKFKPDVHILSPPKRLDIHIRAREEPTASSQIYTDMVYRFLGRVLWSESVLNIEYEVTVEDPAGQFGLDILIDLFGLLNGRLDIFRRIYISVPESDMSENLISSGNLLGLEEGPPRIDSMIKLDNAFHLGEFRWSGNFDLLKENFQIPFSRLSLLSLLRCRIGVDDACLLLAQCHDLRGLEIGTLVRTDLDSTTTATSGCSNMPTTWWRHFKLRFMFLESLTIISECLLLEFTSRLALNDPRCGLKLKTLSLTFLNQQSSRRISELEFPWSRLKNVHVEFEIGIIPSEESLRNDLVNKCGVGKSTRLRINEAKIKRGSQELGVVRENRCELVVEVEEGASDRGDGSPVSELNFGGDQVSLLTLPD